MLHLDINAARYGPGDQHWQMIIESLLVGGEQSLFGGMGSPPFFDTLDPPLQ